MPKIAFEISSILNNTQTTIDKILKLMWNTKHLKHTRYLISPTTKEDNAQLYGVCHFCQTLISIKVD